MLMRDFIARNKREFAEKQKSTDHLASAGYHLRKMGYHVPAAIYSFTSYRLGKLFHKKDVQS
jgi:hypothetical protein